MCRYSDTEYKSHYVCVKHRFTAKHPRDHQEHLCPTCRVPMVNAGRDFKAPRKEATNQWKKLEILFEQGIAFESCGCTGPGPRPATLAQAKNPLLL
jgi:hypothetical protein